MTATLPYLLIGIFIWRAMTLPGASRGLQYFFTPRWELLGNAEVLFLVILLAHFYGDRRISPSPLIDESKFLY